VDEKRKKEVERRQEERGKQTLFDATIFDHLIDDDVCLFNGANDDLLSDWDWHEALASVVAINVDL